MISIRTAALAALATLALPGVAACAPEGEAPAGDSATAAASSGLTVSNARLVLPPVAGNPAAVYFDLTYTGSGSVTLEDVAVEGAKMAMIHMTSAKNGVMTMSDAGTVTLKPGEPVSFMPGGLHVMAMEPSDTIVAGATAEVTLTLSDGTTAIVAAPVRAAGEER